MLLFNHLVFNQEVTGSLSVAGTIFFPSNDGCHNK